MIVYDIEYICIFNPSQHFYTINMYCMHYSVFTLLKQQVRKAFHPGNQFNTILTEPSNPSMAFFILPTHTHTHCVLTGSRLSDP